MKETVTRLRGLPFASVGDAAHVVTLVSALAFAIAVVRRREIFDPAWRRDGFCVANLDVPYWTSHDLCLYFDVLAAAILAAVYVAINGWGRKAGKSPPGLETANDLIKKHIPGIVAHGIGHGMIGLDIRNRPDRYGPDNEYGMYTSYESLMEHSGEGILSAGTIRELLPAAVFWWFLVKSSCGYSLDSSKVAAVVAVGMSIQMFVPRMYAFTYVQTFLMAAFALDQTMRPRAEKDSLAYALYPVVVSVPVTLMGWAESTMCTRFVRDNLYGHLAYDANIPVSMLVWYLACYFHAIHGTTKADERKTSKKSKNT